MNDTSFSTPMMKQYIEIKKQHPDCLLFFRLGDFYELFQEDAKIGAHVLGITLTSRSKGKDGKIPMAGVPYHAVDGYLSKLVKAGYKVAICEQTSEPNKKGIVEREVVRVVTPATVLDEKALNQKEHNYLVSIVIEKESAGIAFCDASTGDFQVVEIQGKNLDSTINDLLGMFNPSECILPEKLYTDSNFIRHLKRNREINIYCFQQWDLFVKQSSDLLKKHFKVVTLESFGIDKKPFAIMASAALVGYLSVTQKNSLLHINHIQLISPSQVVQLDHSTILNLEIFNSIRTNDPKGSLIYHLDQTKTALGGRLLRQWLLSPLTDKTKINNRLAVVEYLLNHSSTQIKISNLLQQILDIERICARLASGVGNPRDIIGLKQSLLAAQTIFEIILNEKIQTQLSEKIEKCDTSVFSLIELITQRIVDDPPLDPKAGGIIKNAVHKELDDLRDVLGGGKEWISEFEKQERLRTQINSLKVRFNTVFGFYIEVSNTHREKIPLEYVRKQTLVNAERFITPSLKKQEEIVLTAQEKSIAIEFELFQETIQKILEFIVQIQMVARIIAEIDCLVNFSVCAQNYNYKKPEIVSENIFSLVQSRHPTVERLLENTPFVPNDIYFDEQQTLLMITGPNMGGKSVVIRQVALIALMAHIGSYVPAHEAKIPLLDRIFVRSGASDAVALGLSTFMVEMVETAAILHNASSHSLVILDEIGRGTSTYDGLSIAWAIAQYLVTDKYRRPKTLFATHYHELQLLAEKFPVIKNFQVAVEKHKDELIFLHTLMPGGTSHSYGIAVAQLAGIPKEVIKQAESILSELENKQNSLAPKNTQQANSEQISLFSSAQHPAIEKIKNLDINSLTPLEALTFLSQLQKDVS